MSNKYFALMSNACMLTWITCYMAYYCFILQQFHNHGGSLTNFDTNDVTTYDGMLIAGCVLIQTGLLLAIFKCFCENNYIVYVYQFFVVAGYTLLVVNTCIAFGADWYKQAKYAFNIPLNNLIAVSGVFLQLTLNSYEVTVTDEEDELIAKQNKSEENDHQLSVTQSPTVQTSAVKEDQL